MLILNHETKERNFLNENSSLRFNARYCLAKLVFLVSYSPYVSAESLLYNRG